MASLLSVFLAKQEEGGREGGREGGGGSFGRQLLSVLAAVVSLWAWARGKWEKMKDWMTAKAMSLQVEGWKGTRGGGREGGREGWRRRPWVER